MRQSCPLVALLGGNTERTTFLRKKKHFTFPPVPSLRWGCAAGSWLPRLSTLIVSGTCLSFKSLEPFYDVNIAKRFFRLISPPMLLDVPQGPPKDC